MNLVYHSYALCDQQDLDGKLHRGFMDEPYKFKERNHLDVRRMTYAH